MVRALVIGAAGQDGSYLSEQLMADGTQVYGLTRQGLLAPGGARDPSVLLEDRSATRELIGQGGFDQIYYLAAYHHSAEDPVEPETDLIQRSFAVHFDGLLSVLSALASMRSKPSLFYAASSHVFGITTESPQTEQTPIAPVCPYGISKSAGIHLCRLYRLEHGIRASVGYLYNHESPRRPARFLSRKVARAVVEISRGARRSLSIGNPFARVDWGYSPEYTDAMRRILAMDEPGDYIIASGRSVRVQDFVDAAFARVGLDAGDFLQIDPSLVQKIDRGDLIGNPAKLARATGWAARTKVEELAALMVDAEQKS